MRRETIAERFKRLLTEVNATFISNDIMVRLLGGDSLPSETKTEARSPAADPSKLEKNDLVFKRIGSQFVPIDSTIGAE